MREILIGVLDIQGSVEEHLESLKRLGVSVRLVKKVADLEEIDGLIIPGGESTTISKLLIENGLHDALVKMPNLPIWGTCAGAILIAKKITQGGNKRMPRSLRRIDITIDRNSYGSQVDSFETEIAIEGFSKKFPAIFIRAPRIKKTGADVKILARHEGEPIFVQQGKTLASTFHPELTSDLRIHKYFVDLCKK